MAKFWQPLDQRAGELTSFREGARSIGQFGHQPGQLFDRFWPAQGRQASSFLPRIKPELGQRRNHA